MVTAFDGHPVRLERTRMQRMPGSYCSIVAQTDGLVFALPPSLYDRMKQVDYGDNIYSLGIDWMFICAAYARGQIAVVDEAVLLRHTITRGYSSEKAQKQKHDFLKQLFSDEKTAYVRLKAHVRTKKIWIKIIHKFKFNLKNRIVFK